MFYTKNLLRKKLSHTKISYQNYLHQTSWHQNKPAGTPQNVAITQKNTTKEYVENSD